MDIPGVAGFFSGWQQDLRLAVVPPVLCAVFRFLFIWLDGPKRISDWKGSQLRTCFSYGFWWGMDINSRFYLLTLALVTLPGSFIWGYYGISDTVRLVLFVLYGVVLYAAFMGKRIFYYHFHDVYNRNMWLGKNADKKNLLDIFFNQNHGAWILLGTAPYVCLLWLVGSGLQSLPLLELPLWESVAAQYAMNTAIFLFSIAIYYWFNFGGTFRHRLKPEWDEVPAEVKNDVFLGKATMDDLVALKIVWKHPVPEFMSKDDETAARDIRCVLPDFAGTVDDNPLLYCRRIAGGARIRKPGHIFFILEESHCQGLYDAPYDMLDIVKYTKRLRQEPGAFVLNNFQPGGMISQTALGSILLGIYDCDVELNENKIIWDADLQRLPTTMAGQLRRLGYRTHFWYGGSLNWGSLVHFAPSAGFDRFYGGPDFCPPGSPSTWLGVYDHIYLEAVAEKIQAEADGTPEFHFVYTTSNHGPYNIPYEMYGVHEEDAVRLPLGDLKQGDMDMRRFTGILYSDKAVGDFVSRMRELYPDSLFILTGDHASAVAPLDKGIIPRKDRLLREHILTSFSMHHPDLKPEFFAGNVLGEHHNILPTIMELIAPEGFEYYSLKPPLTEKISHVVTPYSWMDGENIGFYKDDVRQQLASSAEDVPMEHGNMQYRDEWAAWQGITGWLLRHPELID
ncbi:LTA synthase family protein [Anaerovibrio sp.]|uniref:LTA synthase family protein n=1 Tax=Anaerovibrio sp. TaxID=1872532 RepID=UPI003F156346